MGDGMEKTIGVASGLATLSIGLVLAANQTLIGFLPKMIHLVGGWALVVLGGIAVFQKAAK